MDEIYQHAVKLLRRRDYTVGQMRRTLGERFGNVPEPIIDRLIERLIERRFLDDRRFAENVVSRRDDAHPSKVLADLVQAGVAREIARQAIDARSWPSLQDVLKAKMNAWHLRPPLERRETARLFRALSRLGYEEEEIREELEQLHEQ